MVNTQATSAGRRQGPAGADGVPADQPPARLPGLRQGRRVPAAEPGDEQRPRRDRGSPRRKRLYPKPINISAQVLLDRERCVLCARCTRFSEQIAGDPFIALIERGALQQVGIYEQEPFESYFSGNTIQICPVGALTSSAYRFRSRPFDLVSTPVDRRARRVRLRHPRRPPPRQGDAPPLRRRPRGQRGVDHRQGPVRVHLRQPARTGSPTRMVRDDGRTASCDRRAGPRRSSVAARGLAAARDAGGVGVLTGGRLTAEDSYAYSKFARVALGTNDIDFRARAALRRGGRVPGRRGGAERAGRRRGDVRRPRRPPAPSCSSGSSPRTRPATIFLRLRKAARGRLLPIYSIAPYTSRGLHKMGGTVVPTAPGAEATGPRGPRPRTRTVALDTGGIVLVGERLAAVPGALTAAVGLAADHRCPASRGSRVAPVTGVRRKTGCLPNLLPGGRPVADAASAGRPRRRVGSRRDPPETRAWTARASSPRSSRVTSTRSSSAVWTRPTSPISKKLPPQAPRGSLLRGRPRGARFEFTRAGRRGLPGRAGQRQGRFVRELGGPGPGPLPARCSTTRCLAARRPRARRHRRGAWPVRSGIPAPPGAGRRRDGAGRPVGRRARVEATPAVPAFKRRGLLASSGSLAVRRGRNPPEPDRSRSRPDSGSPSSSSPPGSTCLDDGRMQEGDESMTSPPPARRSRSSTSPPWPRSGALPRVTWSR